MDEKYRKHLYKKIRDIMTGYTTMDEWTKRDYVYECIAQLIRMDEESGI